MNAQFKSYFDTEELKAIYSTLPPKLLNGKIEDVKKILKAAIEPISREKYKRLFS